MAKTLENLMQEIVYIKGPEGIGKSFALLNSVLQSRTPGSVWRIFYINNPQAMLLKWKEYIVKEFIYTIGLDIDDLNQPEGKKIFGVDPSIDFEESLRMLCLQVLEENDNTAAFKRIRNLIEKLQEYLKNKERQLVLLCDQYTTFDRDEVKENYGEVVKLAKDFFRLFEYQIYGSSDRVVPVTGSMLTTAEIVIEEPFSFQQGIEYLKLNLKENTLKLDLPDFEALEKSYRQIKDGDQKRKMSRSQETIGTEKRDEAIRLNKRLLVDFPDLLRIYEETEFYPYDLEIITTLIRKEPSQFKAWEDVLREFKRLRSDEIMTGQTK